MVVAGQQLGVFLREEAVVASAQLQSFPRLPSAPTKGPIEYLRADGSGVSLVALDASSREHVVRVDFTGGAVDRRRRTRDELLFRAVGGVRPGLPVLDATAGLGTDAFLLASAGCIVTAYERNAAVFALLDDARSRALRYPELRELFDQRFRLVLGDARQRLQSGPAAEVVLIDPMFPQDARSALTKQQMRTLRGIVGDDPDSAELLKTALDSGAHRVVVKRMHDAEAIRGPAPSFQLADRTTRFDVYVQASRSSLSPHV